MQNNILCVACKQVPINVVESGCCSSLYCWECAVAASVCQHCHHTFSLEECKPNVPLRRILEGLEIKCKFEGCSVCVTANNQKKHETECLYCPVTCPNSDLCGIMLRKDVINHLEKLCLYRKIFCPFRCGKELTFVEIETHISNECYQAEISCPNCDTSLKRCDLQNHVQLECTKAPITCEFAEYGCNQNLFRHEYANHLEMELKNHFSLLATGVRNQAQQIKSLQVTVKELSQERDRWNCGVTELRSSIQSFARLSASDTVRVITEGVAQGKSCVRQFFAQVTLVQIVMCFALWALFNFFPILKGIAFLVSLIKIFRWYRSSQSIRSINHNYASNTVVWVWVIFLACLLAYIHPIRMMWRMYYNTSSISDWMWRVYYRMR